MKKPISVLLLLLSFSCTALYGQYGLQASVIAPTGYYSYLLKPGYGIELFYKAGDPDSHYSFGVAFGYNHFSPTQDTFKTYAVGGSNNLLLPGYEVIYSYGEFSSGVMNDYRVLPDAKFCPVFGLDVYFYVIGVGEDYYIETLESSTGSGDDYYWLLSVAPKVGVQYKITDDLYLTGFFGRSMSIIGTVPNQAFWKTSVTISYNMN